MMRRHRILTAIAGAALLITAGCSASPAQQDGPTDHAAADNSGLPTARLTITEGNVVHRFTVELARTEAEQARGLMFRTELAPDRGMLFPYSPPQPVAFWMKDTLIPLDMIFIRADGSIDRIAENTVPESMEPVASGGAIAAVLEVAGGTAARLNITENATVRWQQR